MPRRVVLLCGPPGAGKTTWARASGLLVYDRDDPIWQGSESTFRTAIARLALGGDHQAVVIRAGATRQARAATAHLIGATETKVLAVDAATCKARVRARARDHPSMSVQLIAVDAWWAAFEPDMPVTRHRW